MTKEREALKLALEALKWNWGGEPLPTLELEAITAIEQALAQPAQQEPVAWESLLGAIARGWCHEKNANKEMDADLVYAIATEIKALYTSPPAQRTWVGLTDEEMHECWGDPLTPLGMKHARMIETKLKEKNCDES